MVQIKLSVAFVLAAAAIAPIVAVPVKTEKTSTTDVKLPQTDAVKAVKSVPNVDAVAPAGQKPKQGNMVKVLPSVRSASEASSEGVARDTNGGKQRHVQVKSDNHHATTGKYHNKERDVKAGRRGKHSERDVGHKAGHRHTVHRDGQHKLHKYDSDRSEHKGRSARRERHEKASHHKENRRARKLERAEVLSNEGNVDSGFHHRRRKAHELEKADYTPPVNADSKTLSAREDLVEELEQRSPQGMGFGGGHHHHSPKRHNNRYSGHPGRRHSQHAEVVPSPENGDSSAVSARDDLVEEFERSFDDIDLDELAAREFFDEILDLD